MKKIKEKNNPNLKFDGSFISEENFIINTISYFHLTCAGISVQI